MTTAKEMAEAVKLQALMVLLPAKSQLVDQIPDALDSESSSRRVRAWASTNGLSLGVLRREPETLTLEQLCTLAALMGCRLEFKLTRDNRLLDALDELGL